MVNQEKIQQTKLNKQKKMIKMQMIKEIISKVNKHKPMLQELKERLRMEMTNLSLVQYALI